MKMIKEVITVIYIWASNNPYIAFVLLIGGISSSIREIFNTLNSIKEIIVNEDKRNAVRIIFTISINVLLGFIIPWLLFFADWSSFPIWSVVLIKVISFWLFGSNLYAWCMVGYIFYLMSDLPDLSKDIEKKENEDQIIQRSWDEIIKVMREEREKKNNVSE